MNPITLGDQTRETLESFMASLPAPQRETVAAAFRELLASPAGESAPGIGEPAPDFTLPHVRGGELSLLPVLASGRPVVLSFYRGSWCPFCNLELNALQQHMPDIRACGARLIAVSPEQPDSSLSHAEKLKLEFDVLSDRGNEVARRYGLVMSVAEPLRPLYREWGLDLPTANGDETWELPLPATFVIDHTGTVRAAHVDKDYTRRMEPDDIIETLRNL